VGKKNNTQTSPYWKGKTKKEIRGGGIANIQPCPEKKEEGREREVVTSSWEIAIQKEKKKKKKKKKKKNQPQKKWKHEKRGNR